MPHRISTEDRRRLTEATRRALCLQGGDAKQLRAYVRFALRADSIRRKSLDGLRAGIRDAALMRDHALHALEHESAQSGLDRKFLCCVLRNAR